MFMVQMCLRQLESSVAELSRVLSNSLVRMNTRKCVLVPFIIKSLLIT